jgi:hypothetical protein
METDYTALVIDELKIQICGIGGMIVTEEN